jgi:hypothetical protein
MTVNVPFDGGLTMNTTSCATDKQVRYLIILLGKSGYATTHMNGQFKRLGATMRQRSGTVEEWLRSLTMSEASQLIDHLANT